MSEAWRRQCSDDDEAGQGRNVEANKQQRSVGDGVADGFDHETWSHGVGVSSSKRFRSGGSVDDKVGEGWRRRGQLLLGRLWVWGGLFQSMD